MPAAPPLAPRGNAGLRRNRGLPPSPPPQVPPAGLHLPPPVHTRNGWERPWGRDTWVLPQICHCLCPLGQLPHSLSLTLLICKIAPAFWVVEGKVSSAGLWVPSALGRLGCDPLPPPSGQRNEGKRPGPERDSGTAGQRDSRAALRPPLGVWDPRRTPATWRPPPASPRRLPGLPKV